jgi:hypothetical protein
MCPAPFAWEDPAERQIQVTGGGPLGGWIYQLRMQRWVAQIFPGTTYSFHLMVTATRHVGQNFFVRDGDDFQVRLDRMTGTVPATDPLAVRWVRQCSR